MSAPTGPEWAIIKMAELIKNGMSFSDALAESGAAITNEAGFRSAASKILGESSKYITASQRVALQQAPRILLGEAAEATGAGLGAAGAASGGGIVSHALTSVGSALGFSGGAALVAGAVITTAVLGGIAYFGSKLVGERSGDRPVATGPQASQPRAEQTAPPGTIGDSSTDEKYAVYLVEGSFGGDIFVGQRSKIDAYPTCKIAGWGTDCTKTLGKIAAPRAVSKLYKSGVEAYHAYCADLVPGTEYHPPAQPYVKQMRLKFDGQLHNIINAPDC